MVACSQFELSPVLPLRFHICPIVVSSCVLWSNTPPLWTYEPSEHLGVWLVLVKYHILFLRTTNSLLLCTIGWSTYILSGHKDAYLTCVWLFLWILITDWEKHAGIDTWQSVSPTSSSSWSSLLPKVRSKYMHVEYYSSLFAFTLPPEVRGWSMRSWCTY